MKEAEEAELWSISTTRWILEDDADESDEAIQQPIGEELVAGSRLDVAAQMLAKVLARIEANPDMMVEQIMFGVPESGEVFCVTLGDEPVEPLVRALPAPPEPEQPARGKAKKAAKRQTPEKPEAKPTNGATKGVTADTTQEEWAAILKGLLNRNGGKVN